MTDDFTIREQAHKSCEKNCNGTFHEEVYCEGFYNGYKAGYHECEKEHEWHYVKDGNPDNENDILCQISKDEVEVGYYHTKEKRYYTIDGKPIDVIRWQKIVFPKESE